MAHRWGVTSWISGILVSLGTVAGDDVDLQVVGRWESPRRIAAYSLHRNGDQLWASMQGDGWWILDIRDPARITPLGSFPAGAREAAQSATTDGSYAYLAAGPGGVHVLDVSDPTRPRRIGGFRTRGFASRMAVSGNLLCVAGSDPALTLLDVSDPSNPVQRGELVDRGASDVVVRGSVAYLTSSDGIRVVDLSDPSLPRVLTNATPGAGGVGTLSLQGTWLYGSGSRLLALDVSDPRAPRNVPTGLPLGQLTGVAALGSRVALAGSSPELTVVDVSQPDAFPVVGRSGSPFGSASAVALGPGHAYLAVNGPILAIAMTPATELPRAQVVPLPPGGAVGLGLTANGNSLLFAANALHAMDTRDPLDPVTVSTNRDMVVHSGIVVAGTQGIGNSGGKVAVWDLADPVRPVLRGASDTLGTRSDVLVADERRAFLGGFGRLDRVDLSRPDSPRPVARHEGSDAFRALVLSGDRLYAATQVPDLISFEVGGETNLVVVGRQELPGIVTWMAVDGSRLLLSGGSPQWLQIRSLEDSTRPTLIGGVSNLPPFSSAALRPPHLYLTGLNSGISVYDVSDPEAIRRVAGNSAVRASNLAADARALYAASASELTVLPWLSDPPAYRAVEAGQGNDGFGFRIRGIPGSTARILRGTDAGSLQAWREIRFGDLPAEIRDPEATNRALYQVVLP